MYNAENYIVECLDSVLMQTFQDFEVLVVDDCSTDNSLEIVKNYAPKFGGRLKLFKTKKNSGGGGYVPRNIGIKLSSGEYIFLLDADDFILLTALETVYKAAKENDADAVYIGARYLLTTSGEANGEINVIRQERRGKQSFTLNDPDKNLQMFFFKGCHHTPYQKFCRRDFLIENKIFFPEIITHGDSIWTIHVFSCSKRFLQINVPIYFYRKNLKSITNLRTETKNDICYRVKAFLLAVNTLYDLSNKIKLLKQNPEYLPRIVKNMLRNFLLRTEESRSKISIDELFEILYRGFEHENNLSPELVQFFFRDIIEREKEIASLKSHLSELETEVEHLKNKS